MSIISTVFAFLSVAPAIQRERSAEPPTFPKRTWHSRNRLDIRPVLWSLRNRPEEWKSDGNYTVDHMPSGHEFWIANGFFFYGLYSANGCSCKREREGSLSLIQKFQFGRAYGRWSRWHRAMQQPNRDQVNAQFAAHFIPKE